MKYFVALVIKRNLKNNLKGIPDILFVADQSKDEAIKTISRYNFEDDLWIKGKSICAVSKIMDITRLKDRFVLGKLEYRRFLSKLQEQDAPKIRRRKKRG